MESCKPREPLSCSAILLQQAQTQHQTLSCNERAGRGGVVLESGGDLLLRLVVSRQSVDSRLDQDEAKLGVLVLAVDFQVFPDSDGLFDEMPEVLRDGGTETCSVQ